MAVASSNSSVIRLVSGDSIPDSLAVSSLAIVSLSTTTGAVDLEITEGDGSTRICRLTVLNDKTHVLPFGPGGKTFPNGIAFTQGSHELILFLA